MAINYLEGTENIHRIPYDSFIKREAANRDIKPSEMERLIETESIARVFPNHGYGAGYNRADNPIQQLAQQYFAITDFDIQPIQGLLAFLTGASGILVQGTCITLKENK